MVNYYIIDWLANQFFPLLWDIHQSFLFSFAQVSWVASFPCSCPDQQMSGHWYVGLDRFDLCERSPLESVSYYVPAFIKPLFTHFHWIPYQSTLSLIQLCQNLPNVVKTSKTRFYKIAACHTVASPPYSIHLGKKFLILNHSKVKSSLSEVQIGVSILLIIPKILILGHK